MITVNTQYFREAALYYNKHGHYEDGVYDTYEYHSYWERERDRCLNGYSVGGQRITGYHYTYLNYTPITVVKKRQLELYGEVFKNRVQADRVTDFADFWDVDLEFFTEFELAEIAGEHFWYLKPRGVGAEQPHSEILITPTGETTMGQIVPGTKLIDHTGNVTIVKEVLPQGVKEIWEVKLLDGRIVTCGEDHLWKVMTGKQKGKVTSKVMKTKDILNSGLSYKHATGQKTYKYKIPKLDPVQFKTRNLDIPPYIMGALLGDGSICGKNIKIATDDQEIVDRFKELLPNYNINRDSSNNNYLIGHGYGVLNELKNDLEAYGVNVKGEDKFIPNDFIYNSIENRLELVKGLMDTDGSITAQGYCEFTNKSKKLVDGLAYILRSLGIYCSIGEDNRERDKTITDRTGRVSSFKEEGTVYRLYIATNQNIFHLTRKSSRINTTKFTKTEVPIIDIKRTGRFEEQSCIIVDNSEHLYLTRDFIVTHNSWKASSMLHRNYNMIPKSRGYMVTWDSEALLGDGLFSKWIDQRNFINQPHPDEERYLSAFGRPSDFKKDQNDMWFRASSNIDGKELGYMSEVMGITLRDNIDKARGKRGKLIVLEEVGANPVADTIHNTLRASVEQGDAVYGTILGLGTGGTVSSKFGAMERVIYNPKAYNIRAFKNTYDENMASTFISFFSPAYKSIAFKDANGNSDERRAKEFHDKNREEAASSSDANAIVQYKSENPYTPQEAILRNTTSVLPSNEALEWYTKVIGSGLHTMGVNGMVENVGGVLTFKPSASLKPVLTFPHNIKEDLTGCVVQYYAPFKLNGRVPDNLYIIAHDPYAFDQSTDSESLGAAYVYMQPNNISGAGMGDKIVATYFGRPKTADDYNKQLFLLAQLYNAKIGFENDRGDVIGYAKRFKYLDWLAEEFELAFDADLPKSKVKRNFGMHIGSGKENLRMHKGNKYLNDWLIGQRGKDEDGKSRLNLHTIVCPATLKEIQLYRNDGGNFDRISALRILAYFQKELVYKDQQPTTPVQQSPESFFNKKFF